ncbi:MAG TPA: hypothetical protein VGJ38_09475 [Jatrophihabitantaceae bacterium]
MDTGPRQPGRYHYEAAERLLAAAESSISAEMQTADALIAIGHAILADVDPRKLRRRRVAPGLPPTGGSPRQRWLSGEDYTDKEK